MFENLNEAVEWCENYLLFKYYEKIEQSEPRLVQNTSGKTMAKDISPTPRIQQLNRAAPLVINSVD
jgi:hypothetical protein